MPPKSKTTKVAKATKSTKAVKKAAKTPKPAEPPPPRKWAKCNQRFLAPELRRRQLPTCGRQSILIARLKATDPPTLRTPAGRKAAYERQLKRLQNAALKKVTPFPYFQKLPLELREKIWEFSLPGPRVVTLNTGQRLQPDRLMFSRIFKSKNPAALQTCKESRTVALRRYKLAFGTPNVYFDFEGCDVLYFGPECFSGALLDQDWVVPVWTQHIAVMTPLHNDIVKDLENVRHLAVAKRLWNSAGRGYGWYCLQNPAGVNYHDNDASLRRTLMKFKGVKRVSLEYGTDTSNDQSGVVSGGLVIEDLWFEEEETPKVILTNIKFVADEPKWIREKFWMNSW